MKEGKDAEMRFRLAPVELSLQAAVSKEAGGKVAWHVLGLGGSYSSAITHALKIRLEPVGGARRRLLHERFHDRRYYI